MLLTSPTSVLVVVLRARRSGTVKHGITDRWDFVRRSRRPEFNNNVTRRRDRGHIKRDTRRVSATHARILRK